LMISELKIQLILSIEASTSTSDWLNKVSSALAT
jgi:hypothetical protein